MGVQWLGEEVHAAWTMDMPRSAGACLSRRMNTRTFREWHVCGWCGRKSKNELFFFCKDRSLYRDCFVRE